MRASEFITETEHTQEGWRELAAAGLLGMGLATAAPKAGAVARADAITPTERPAAARMADPQPAEQPGTRTRVIRPATNHPNELVLIQEALRHGIQGAELAQLLAQARHETENFTRLVERGTVQDFRRYDPRHNPERARILGNTQPGDGARYRGRGYLHITGKYWYRLIGQALGVDLVANPDLMARPDIAARASIWFWQNQVMRHNVDPTNTQAVTRRIHPGLRHLDQRIAYYAHYIRSSEP